MTHAKLRRCHICKKFHASYLVDAPDLGGQVYLCYDCWKARYGSPSPAPGDQVPEKRTGEKNRSNGEFPHDPPG